MTSGAILSLLTYVCFIDVQDEFYRACMNMIVQPAKPVESCHVTSIEAIVNPTRYATVPATIALWSLGEGVERPIVNLGMDLKTKGLIILATAWEQVCIYDQVVDCFQVSVS